MGIINSPQSFKPSVYKLTEFRLKMVMKYIAHCYLEMVKDGRKYKFSERGKIQKEDFLRNGFVDDYLTKKKEHYKNHISDNSNVEIYFQKEENHPYKIKGNLSDDYIDISIKETKLSEVLSGESEDEIKFAIECKRIKETGDYSEYLKDIRKLADRPFVTYRLPYEGQIAFIENSNHNHTKVANEINSRLAKTTTINTIQLLTALKFHDNFEGGYSSSHKRNHTNKDSFLIFHLLFDYTQIVLD